MGRWRTAGRCRLTGPSAIDLRSCRRRRLKLGVGGDCRARSSSGGARDGLDDVSHGLRRARMTRDVIGQAKGILMERFRITPDDAFDVLRHASQT